MLQVNSIKAAYGAKHRVKRVGRGNASGHGTSATRGGKGQTARSGGSKGLKQKGFRRLMQSTPKLRGFRSLNTAPSEVYLSDLEKHFKAGDTVTLAALQAKGIVSSTVRRVKVVTTGIITKKLTIQDLLATKGAIEKIAAVGGEIK